MKRREFIALAGGAAGWTAVARMPGALAQPSRPVTIIVPYAAGGPTDVLPLLRVSRVHARPLDAEEHEDGDEHRAAHLLEQRSDAGATAHVVDEDVDVEREQAQQDEHEDRDHLGDRHDPVLILGKALGLEWVTVRALVLLRLGPTRVPSPTDIENVRTNFVRLMPVTAERVVNFWQTRQSA